MEKAYLPVTDDLLEMTEALELHLEKMDRQSMKQTRIMIIVGRWDIQGFISGHDLLGLQLKSSVF